MSVLDELKEEMSDGFMDRVQRRRIQAAIEEINRLREALRDISCLAIHPETGGGIGAAKRIANNALKQ